MFNSVSSNKRICHSLSLTVTCRVKRGTESGLECPGGARTGSPPVQQRLVGACRAERIAIVTAVLQAAGVKAGTAGSRAAASLQIFTTEIETEDATRRDI